MKINTYYLDRSIETLESAFGLPRQHEPEEIAYSISRSACVKEFEIIEELSGSLLRSGSEGTSPTTVRPTGSISRTSSAMLPDMA